MSGSLNYNTVPEQYDQKVSLCSTFTEDSFLNLVEYNANYTHQNKLEIYS